MTKFLMRNIVLGFLFSVGVFLSPSASAQGIPGFDPPGPLQSNTPQNLVAISASGSQVNLSWDAVTTGWATNGYLVYRCEGAGCTPTVQVSSMEALAQPVYADTNLVSGTTYGYAVTAYNNLDVISETESDKTATVFVTTQARQYVSADFATLVSDWLKVGQGIASDVNGDGVVNTFDIGVMMDSWSGQ